jgi:hypothetical protein
MALFLGCAVPGVGVLAVAVFLAIWQFLSPGGPPPSAVDGGVSAPGPR